MMNNTKRHLTTHYAKPHIKDNKRHRRCTRTNDADKAEQFTKTNKAECQMMPNKVKQRLMMPDNNEQHRTMTNDVEKMTNETPNDDKQHQTTQNKNKSYTAQRQ